MIMLATSFKWNILDCCINNRSNKLIYMLVVQNWLWQENSRFSHFHCLSCLGHTSVQLRSYDCVQSCICSWPFSSTNMWSHFLGVRNISKAVIYLRQSFFSTNETERYQFWFKGVMIKVNFGFLAQMKAIN